MRQLRASRSYGSPGWSLQGQDETMTFEYHILQKMNHENVVKCFEMGIHHGVPALVLEYLPLTLRGAMQNFEERCKACIPYRQVALLSRKLVLGLSHVHQKQVFTFIPSASTLDKMQGNYHDTTSASFAESQTHKCLIGWTWGKGCLPMGRQNRLMRGIFSNRSSLDCWGVFPSGWITKNDECATYIFLYRKRQIKTIVHASHLYKLLPFHQIRWGCLGKRVRACKVLQSPGRVVSNIKKAKYGLYMVERQWTKQAWTWLHINAFPYKAVYQPNIRHTPITAATAVGKFIH